MYGTTTGQPWNDHGTTMGGPRDNHGTIAGQPRARHAMIPVRATVSAALLCGSSLAQLGQDRAHPRAASPRPHARQELTPKPIA
eukprot:934674-Pyramimonas_sp.AAC.1